MATNCLRRSLLLASLVPLLAFAQLVDRSPWRPSRSTTLDFGSCSNPGITWGYDLDGSQQYGYAPTDQTQFPHGFSSDISSLEVYICNRLQFVCNASPSAVRASRNAFELYSGLSGQNAADRWNEALGVYGSAPTSTDYGTTTTAVATVLVSGTSVPYTTLFSAVSTAYSESLSSSLLSSYVSPTYTIFSTKTISQDPSSTSTVHGTNSPTTTSTSTVILPVSTSTSSADVSTSIIVPTGPTTITTTTSFVSTATAQAQNTGTGSADGGGSPFSGAIAQRRELEVALFAIVFAATLNLLL